MAAKLLFVACVSALFVQVIHGCGASRSCGCGCGCGAGNYGYYGAGGCGSASTCGGGFSVTTSSPLAPLGLFVVSQNDICGILDTSGSFPVLATVALEETLLTDGSASTSYSCGDGSVAITGANFSGARLGHAGYGAYGLGHAGYYGLYGAGCGCGYGTGCGCGAGYGCGYGAGYGCGCGAGYGCGYGARYGCGCGCY